MLRVGTLIFNLPLVVERVIHDYSKQAMVGFKVAETDDKESTFMVPGRKGLGCWTHVIRNSIKNLCTFAKLTDTNRIKSLEREAQRLDAAESETVDHVFGTQGSGPATAEGGGARVGSSEQ